MASSLASQLANIGSLNAQRLASTSSLNHHTSYLFPPKTAAQQDIFTVHALGTSGWNELCSQDSSLAQWEHASILFSDQSRQTDRLMLPKEENDAIDLAVREFLTRVGALLLSKGASKCLEWLVRRFRIHEFSPEDVLAAFLPYHDTPQFGRMLSICKIEGKPHLQFLLALKKTSSPLPSSVLQTALLAPTNTTASLDLLRWVANLITVEKTSTGSSLPHRVLVSFWTSTLVQMCARWAGQDRDGLVGGLSKSTSNKKKSTKAMQMDAQSMLTVLLPAAVQVAGAHDLGLEAQVGGYMLLCSVASAFPLSKQAVQGIFASLAKSRSGKTAAAADHPALSRALLAASYSLCSSPEDASDPLTLQSVAADRLVPDSIARALVSIGGLTGLVKAAAQTYNVEPFVTHLLSALVVRLAEEAFSEVLKSLLLMQTLSDAVAIKVIRLLLELLIPADKSEADGLAFVKHLQGDQVAQARANRVKILSGFRQQRASLFDAAVQQSTAALQGSIKLNAVWAIVRSVMSVEAGASFDKAANGDIESDTNVLWLAIHSADAAQRNLALKELLAEVATGKVSATDTLVKDALQSRVHDSSHTVLETLYSHPKVLIQALDADTLLDAVVEALSANTLSPAELAHHLSFLLVSFVPAHPQHASKVVRSAAWPRLLFTAASRPIAETTAKIAKESKTGKGNVAAFLLAGAAKVAGEKDVDAGTANDSITSELATQISKLKDTAEFAAWVKFLFTRAAGPKSPQDQHEIALARSSQILAILVLIRLLSQIGEQQFLQLAPGAVNAVALQVLDNSPINNNEAVAIDDADAKPKAVVRGSVTGMLHEQIYRQTESAGTRRQLAGELLQQIVLSTQVPDFSAILESFSAPKNAAVGLLTSIYATVNTASTGAALSKLLLQSLFLRLRDSALPFLANTWVRSEAQCSSAIRLAALRHASAYLQAYAAEGQAKDFQTIVPSLLIALRDSEAPIRMTALACIEDIIAICGVAGSKPKDLEVFGYDKIYGASSKDLQYLELSSLSRYLGEIQEKKSAFRNDANFLAELHKDLLNVKKQDGRKEVNYKYSIVCFLTSHIVCWQDAPLRLSLLDSLQGVSDGSKLTMLVPLIRSLADGVTKDMAGLVAPGQQERYADALFSCYDKSSRSVLEDTSNGSWVLFLESIGGARNSKVQVPAVKALQHGGVFAVLQQPMRQEIYQHLASVVSDPAKPTAPEVQACLRDLNVDASILVPVLSELRETITAKALDAPEAKRARTSLGSDELVRRAASVVVVILESTTGKKLARSGVLIFELFEVLRLSVELHASLTVNAEYMLQLSMSCLVNFLEGLDSDAPAEIIQSLRADTIVSAIKASHNPQTFQHALLLLSRVATIAPEPVLHNVMPIFTFVGSTVLQRDDSFSYTVVERTLKSMVPTLVQSLKKRDTVADSHFSLLCEARAFIRIFTDAAHYVPKHRRQIFFKLLVEIMGPTDFCAAVCMLLVDRSAFKIIKQPRQDNEQTLQLPLVVMQAQPILLQIQALGQVWEEVLRIWRSKDDLDTLSENVFLDRAAMPTREHTDVQAEPIRQIQALILFIRQVLSSKVFAAQMSGTPSKQIGISFEEFIRAALTASDPQTLEHQAINAVAQEASNAAMPFVPIANVMNVVSTLVEDQDIARKTSGFSLFASRISALEADAEDRQEATSYTSSIVSSALEVLREPSIPDALRQACLDTIKSVSATILTSEHSILASTLPVLVSVGQTPDIPVSSQISVFSITRRLADKLGPRLIPYLSKLVPFCLSTVNADASVASLRTGAFDTLTGLFDSVPTFMTSYIAEIVKVSISPSLKLSMASASGSSTASERSLTSLLSSLIKKTPAQSLFDSIFKLYDEVSTDSDRLTGLLSFLARALRQTNRASMASTYKSVFRFILKALDQRRNDPLFAQAEVEEHVIAAFLKLVLKLNESSFRPLFLRMFDWAVLDLVDDDTQPGDAGLVARQIALYKTFNALSDQLKGLVSGYYTVLLDQSIEILSSPTNEELRTAVIASLHKSARHDEGTFWTPSRAAKLSPALMAQLSYTDATLLVKTVAALAHVVPDENTLKNLNASLLQKARNAERKTRVNALKVATALWAKEGEAMLGLVPETVAQLSELLDDDDDTVAREAVGLREKIEVALGESLDSYLT